MVCRVVVLPAPLARRAKHGGQKPRPHAAVASCQHVLQGGQSGEQTYGLEGSGHAQADNLVRLASHQGDIAEQDAARIGRIITGDQVEHRGFARAVGADDAHNAAFLHGEGYVVHGHQAAESFGDVFQAEQGVHAPSPTFVALVVCAPRSGRVAPCGSTSSPAARRARKARTS